MDPDPDFESLMQLGGLTDAQKDALHKYRANQQQELAKREQELEQERQRADGLQRLQQNTTLPEFLGACHTEYFMKMSVASKSESTTGGPQNAKRKRAPDMFLLWRDFPEHLGAIWAAVHASGFFQERHFQ
jgi:hypothetical protein